jgi:hypothetical protein
MASSRTFAVILCVILALLAFVAQDALAARVLGNSRSIFLLGFTVINSGLITDEVCKLLGCR